MWRYGITGCELVGHVVSNFRRLALVPLLRSSPPEQRCEAVPMDDDIDMDAPQISTLREEPTPPPRGSKFRVKLLVGDKRAKVESSSPSVSAAARKNIPQNQTEPQPQSGEEVDEEDEEDQLIDDDEPAPSISTPIATVSTGTKRKAPPKKPSRPRKNDKQDKEDKKPDGESGPHFLYVVALGTKLSLIIEPREPPDNEDVQSVSAAALPQKPPPKKKAAPRKTAAAPKPKIKVPPKYVAVQLSRKQVL